MKSKQTVGSKKQPIIVKDLKTSKNPKGGSLFLKLNYKESPSGSVQGFLK
jgi:translation elongation factor P/translation initiation factor 5A